MHMLALDAMQANVVTRCVILLRDAALWDDELTYEANCMYIDWSKVLGKHQPRAWH